MKKNELINKTLAGLMIAAMTAGVCPTTAFAVTGETIAADNTYTKTVKIEPDEDGEFKAYDVQVSLTVKDGKFSDITVTPVGNVDRKNQSYMNDARDGWGDSAGYSSLVGKAATEDTVNAWDIVSGATCTSKTVKSALVSAINDAPSATVEVNTANLEAAIAKAKGLTAADYTAESWAKLQTALTAADTALTAKESQDAVDAAASNLNTAIDALVKKPEEVKVNTEKLEAAIAKADALKDKEADYTAESWKTMQTALTEAKSALAAKESQDMVDAAEAKLTKATNELVKATVSTDVYVLMNIPYDKFYEAEGDKDDVDAVTSATLNKTRSSLAAGSYHVNSDGSDITGVTYPVKISDASALEKYKKITDDSKVDITTSIKGKTSTTTYTGKDALFESDSYSYYILSETPSYYKEATVNADGSLSFGKTEGTEVKILSNVTADFKTSSNYGDYQINLSELPSDIKTVYGVVIGTKEGDNYGLRHVENIWKNTKLAWSTGFVTEAHGSPLQYKDYVNMMGQTIDKITYYTNAGVYEIPVDIKVPVKFNGSVKVENGKASDGSVSATVEGLPDDYAAEYSVDGLSNVKFENGKLTFAAEQARGGRYTLTVSDKSEKYASLTAKFVLSSEVTPIAYDSDKEALVAADGYTADDVNVYVKNIQSVSVNDKDYNATGKGSVTIINADGTINTAAKPFADAKDGQEFEIEVTSEGYDNNYKFTYKANTQYKYVYAGLTWSEYWANEAVYAAGDSSTSEAVDKRGESDKGAFDTVTRATANHGLHRGSFQCIATIYDADGNSYKVAGWKSASELLLTDGSTVAFNSKAKTVNGKTFDHYEVTGLKYVPVKVAAADYEDFCNKYVVVENGGTLTGGYSEGNLSSYTEKASVTVGTNGLKTATKNTDGTFSFSASENGPGSGISGQSLKALSADEAGLTVKEAKGSYGEFLRVDLTGNYGDLGSNMQAVTWTYYGDDSTYTTPLRTFGTKFAADNWMHKSMGIQLGLTDSLRCQLPEGTDGTGYWTITIRALGYENATYKFKATDENIVKGDDAVQDTSKLEAAIKEAEGLSADDYTEDSWKSMQLELAEAKEELANPHTQSTVDEATEHLNAAIKALVKAENEQATYVLMNIPYDKFYAAEGDADADAVTSATLNKTRSSLAAGSYHVNSDGSDITGIVYPVKLSDASALEKLTQVTDSSKVDITVSMKGKETTTTYEGKDALFESASYSYYVLSEAPSYYKEATVNEDGTLSFGKVEGTEAKTLSGVTAEFSTSSRYGDYQINLSGLPDDITTVYGVVVGTKEGSNYGMRHLENIWRISELAWSTGFVTTAHGSPLQYKDYVNMMGQTINKITYYTNAGIYEIPVDIKVPVKFTHDLEVANAAITAGKTEVTVTGLPDDYAAEYKVDGLDGVSVQNGVLTFSNAKKGKYTLTISDKKGKYADITTEFELYTEAMPAAYDADKKALVKTADATDEEFADYIKSISVVSVNGKDYRATGRGATVIINEDGSIKTDAAPFAEGDTFEITVSATGYLPQSFTYTTKEAPAPAKVNTEALEAAIAKAEGLKEADYTAESWKAMQTSLTSAKAALEAKESQEAVDAAAASLQSSINALVKAETPSTDDEEKVDTAALEKTIATAKGLKKNDYTAATWTTLQTALTNAEKALDAKESQKSVDEAAKTLQAAIDGLKKASDTTATTDDKKNNNNNNSNNNNNNSTNKNNTTNKNTTTSKNSPKTGDPVSVLGLLGAAISSVGIGGLGLRLRKKSKREDEE
ncbi:FMN-binding protein [Coprococcus catus]|uniref:penicillin-binding Tp47 domain C-containing protein n=1 Tax=Coprococcus catus TaxID=116085 RepID=UPI002097BC67|nr:penicillin-binding Tp47 domain C-containing protein [Coprococcus catus]MCO7146253.1 FMN-binding protein [Coprococcus catus]